ncbi:5'-methylthioadenosine/adenosylhomocysteine nucleosidase [Comamonas piscis]|uniref:adenosylhomocysteine nucleosidase n=1 Tax=Comamonas piscis TaxID=1562974 RepID=A0A7G5EDL3_9BURK|nr:5'-methylthioadenosine/adenosylhomocysteine nucleosidase [Comamonas piscis]QMV72088.1 5'-methylthioadenosine/adenosylhomocysteine nucleosidase [Comamonas piscis]WSO34835.1 5'-methylthioadenosine/adenosylhomocysteine nucleosidase [Comamonas piscis]
MILAILSALPEEQAGIAALLSDASATDYAGRRYTCGQLHGHAVVLALSGIGKVAAASTAATLIERFGAQAIVFTGVAGGLGDGVQVGDVVVASSYAQHDMDASPIFPRYEVPGYGRARFDCDAALSAQLAVAVQQCLASDAAAWTAELGLPAPRMHQGLVVSGDRFVSSAAEVQALRSGLQAVGMDALAVEMEGAAVAQVCADHGLPFAAMRSISDRADDSAHLDFPVFVQTVASRYAVAIVQQWLAAR